MAITGQNTVLNQYTPPFCIKGPVDGQALIYDSRIKAFVNKGAPPEDDIRVDINFYANVGTGTIKSYTLPWVTADTKSLIVTIQGVKQHQGSYTVSSSDSVTSTFTFIEPPALGDSFEILGIATATEDDTINLFNAAGDGVITSYVLPWAITNREALMVTIQGVKQSQTAYAVSSDAVTTTVSFLEPPALGDSIEIHDVTVNNTNAINLFTDTTDGVTNEYTLPWAVNNVKSLIVTLQGIKQHQYAYVVTAGPLTTVVTFLEIPVAGEELEILDVMSTIQ